MKNKKGIEFPAVLAVLLAIISFQGGAAIAKGLFSVLAAAATSSLIIILSAIILVVVNRPNLWNVTTAQWKAVGSHTAIGLQQVVSNHTVFNLINMSKDNSNYFYPNNCFFVL